MKRPLLAALACCLSTVGVSHANTLNSCSFDPSEFTIPYGGVVQTTLTYDLTVDANEEMCYWFNGVLGSCVENPGFPPSPFTFGFTWGEVQALGLTRYGLGTSSQELCAAEVTLGPPSIPTLSTWATAALALLMAWAALVGYRRKTE